MTVHPHISESAAEAVDIHAVHYPSTETAQCPYPYYKALREQAPVFKLPGRDEYVITRHEDCLFALRRPDLFSAATIETLHEMGHAPLGGVPTARTDPPEHKKKRQLVSKGFTPVRLASYRPMIQGHVDRLIDKFAARGSVEFVSEFAAPLPIHVMADLFAIPADHYKFLEVWSRLEGSGTRYNPPEWQAEQVARSKELGEYLADLIQQRLDNPGDDLVSELVHGQIARDGELDLGSCVSEAMFLLAGGLFTTAHMIASTLMLLLNNPDAMAKAIEKRSLIPRMLEEGLRVESPVQWSPRVTTQEVEIGGVHIPARTYVLILHASANRDEQRFPCPARFDIERSDTKQHLAFGQGVHFCLGAPLARLEGQMAFDTLFDRLHNIRLVANDSDVTWLDSRIFRALTELHVEFDAAA